VHINIARPCTLPTDFCTSILKDCLCFLGGGLTDLLPEHAQGGPRNVLSKWIPLCQ
jgi:hypothetical protein